jgi:hypothetical protein
MLLFDWKKIYTTAAGDPTDIVRILRMLVEKRIPKNKYDKEYFYSQINFDGTSFLVHPERLLYNGYKYTFREVAIYTGVAALRSLSDFYATNKMTLDVLLVPEEALPYIYENRLLEVENDKIYFLYEGSPDKKEIH